MYRRVTSLTKQSAIYGLGIFLNQGITFFLIPIYTHYLSTEQYGISASVTSAVGVLTILLTLSIETALARFYYDFDSEEQRRSYFGVAWLFLTVFGLALTVLVSLLGKGIFGLILPDVPFVPYGLLAVWGTFVGGASIIPTVLFRVREQPRRFVAFTVSQFLFRILLNIVFVVFLRQGVKGIFIATLIANAVYAIPLTRITFRSVSLSVNWKHLRASLAFSLPFVPHRLGTWVLNVSDRIVLANFVTLADVGLYNLGYRFGTILAAVFDAVNLAFTPFFFKTAREPDGPEALARLVTYFATGVAFLTLATVLLSRAVILLMAAPAFWSAARVVPPVALAYGVNGLYLALVAGPSYVKKTARIPLYTGIAAAINIGANLIFVPRYGIMAAAWSTFAAFLLRTILIGIDSQRVFPLPYEYKRLALSLGLAAVLSAACLFNAANVWADVAIKGSILLAYPILLGLVRFFLPEEVKGLQRLGQSFRMRLTRTLGLFHD